MKVLAILLGVFALLLVGLAPNGAKEICSTSISTDMKLLTEYLNLRLND